MSKNKKSERTREEILDQAWDLIAIHGAEVSLAEIAESVGLTRQSIYVHFGSRGGLLMALVRRADERFGIWHSFGTAMQTKGAETRLEACLEAWFEFVGRIHPVARDLIRLRTTVEAADNAWEDRMQELREVLRHLVQGLKKEGALAKDWTVSKAANYLWVGMSVQSWSLLVDDLGLSEKQAATILKQAISRALLA